MSETSTDPRPNVPGCGLAAYGTLLAAFCVVGLIGSLLSMLAIVFVPSASGPSLLQHGSEVGVWRLQPMREAGLLELTEAPMAFHDESPQRDGVTACGFKLESVIRVEGGVGTSIPFEQITSLSHTGDEQSGMVITSEGTDEQGAPATIRCSFGGDEAGSRFLRQLEVETGLKSAGPSSED